MEDVGDWLRSLGLGEFVGVFTDHGVDLDVLPHLVEQDLADMGLPVGHRRKVLVSISKLSPRDYPTAERRQITVMFCDLVGSTALSERLDPEDLSAVINAYRRESSLVVQRYGGHVAQFLGDGLMVYFGWPSAHEDDAERAVRTALDIINAIKTVEPLGQLRARVGIATGEVVIGKNGAGEELLSNLAVGETPILAARLQSLAEPDDVLIAESTHRLVAGIFQDTVLEQQKLKGISEPVTPWRIGGVVPSQGRFESRHRQRLTPYVGREKELALVLSRWQLAQQGAGQVVVVRGEPGIGKSRLLLEAKDQLASPEQRRLRFQCSPFHTSAPLYPFIEQLEHIAGFAQDDAPEVKLNKLAAVISGAGQPVASILPLLAPLLSLDIDTSMLSPGLILNPQDQQAQTATALCNLALGIQPVVIFFEDVHWIDPTSQKVLTELMESCVNKQALICITHRLEYQSPWKDWDHLLEIELTRLDRSDTTALVENAAQGVPLPAEISELIASKTDGVPLFVEEFTQTVVQSDIVIKSRSVYELNASLNKLDIPSTLHDSLMARLDRSAPMREVAQVGACIGRNFSHDLLAAISPLDPSLMEEGLAQLMHHGLVFTSGKTTHKNYVFKHALVQDVAYNSLLRSKRQQINAKIAEILIRDFPDIASSTPDAIARYFHEAGEFQQAATYWLKAAQRALLRFANVEAASHARNGLDALYAVPETCRPIEKHLSLRMTLVASYRMADYYDDALEELNRAEILARKHSCLAELARIHHLRGNIYFPLGKVDKCLAQHKASLRFAQQAGSIQDEARAYGGVGDGLYMSGSMLEAHKYFERCIKLCQREHLEAIEISYRPMRATTHMYCLRFDSALADCQEVCQMAAKTGRLRGEIIARNISSQILLEKQLYDLAETDAQLALELVAKTGTKRFVPLFNDVLARVKHHRGDSAGALKLLEESWAIAEDTSPTFAGPWILGAMAIVIDDAGQRQSALMRGEALLNKGCVAHNYFWFYRDAIEASLMDGHWEDAASWANKLRDYFSGKPMPWAEFIVERGMALAAWGRSRQCSVVASQLQDLLTYAETREMLAATTCLHAALEQPKGEHPTAQEHEEI